MIDLNDPLAVKHAAQRNRRIRLAQSNRNHRPRVHRCVRCHVPRLFSVFES